MDVDEQRASLRRHLEQAGADVVPDQIPAQRERQFVVVEPRWRPTGDYRVQCAECEWLRIEQFRRASARTAKAHVEETGHTVEVHRKQYKLVKRERAT